jgi:hypothetical protein
MVRALLKLCLVVVAARAGVIDLVDLGRTNLS